jgi:hypothetical protein
MSFKVLGALFKLAILPCHETTHLMDVPGDFVELLGDVPVMSPRTAQKAEHPFAKPNLIVDYHCLPAGITVTPDNRVVPDDEVAAASGVPPHRREEGDLVPPPVKAPRFCCTGIEVDGEYVAAAIGTTHDHRALNPAFNQYAISGPLQQTVRLVTMGDIAPVPDSVDSHASFPEWTSVMIFTAVMSPKIRRPLSACDREGNLHMRSMAIARARAYSLAVFCS